MSGESQENPYEVLGVTPDASDAELRGAYRRLVQRHHPDHNGGSPDSAARFAQVQAAYAHIVGMRRGTAVPPVTPAPGDVAPTEPAVQRRIDEMERELARNRAAQARAEARRQAAAPPPRKPTREELGYFETDDNFSKIFDEASDELSGRWQRSAKKPFTQRLVDLFSRGG